MSDFCTHQFLRLPGLFRRWELGEVIDTGADYRIEDAGTAGDDTPLFAIYVAIPPTPPATEAA